MLRTTTITPADLLDAARTIPAGEISTCPWLANWWHPATSGEWAKQGVADGSPYGSSNATLYAKQAAACRIDVLIQYNHLRPFDRLNYPAKIAALRSIDVEIPDVVQDLVIDPRNAVEHGYQPPSQDAARHSVGVADLFLRATQAEYERASIVAVAWNAMGSYGLAAGRESVQFREFNTRPMLFIDVFDLPATAKIVDPAHQEIRSAELQAFTQAEATALARVIRANYAPPGPRSISGYGPSYYREMKRQAGF